MNKLLIVLLLVACVGFCQSDHVNRKRCPQPHTRYSDCGPFREATCANPNPIIPAVCRSGCFCIRGFIRDNVQRCIPKRACP
ncbi:unnamed protein product [Chironomus riparius]|uniref:TIL domain-containing protein n=1 Tax=Chironomus riparius TaxID=315576 RepID=A0A9N9RQ60_9DIPT|nr:unnamed protein product [Chironomus riparius]